MQDTISGEHLPREFRVELPARRGQSDDVAGPATDSDSHPLLEQNSLWLLLRPWRLDDADDVLAYAADPEWARYLPIPQPYEPRHAVEFLTAQVAADRAVNPIWAIEFEGHAIGGTNLRLEPSAGRSSTSPSAICRSTASRPTTWPATSPPAASWRNPA